MFRAVPLSVIRSFSLYTQQWYMSYRFAVSKPVWHIPLLCVQRKTPDDGQRNCPKHVDFYSTNKFEKLVHLVGFIIRIYHDLRSPETSNSSDGVSRKDRTVCSKLGYSNEFHHKLFARCFRTFYNYYTQFLHVDEICVYQTVTRKKYIITYVMIKGIINTDLAHTLCFSFTSDDRTLFKFKNIFDFRGPFYSSSV